MTITPDMGLVARPLGSLLLVISCFTLGSLSCSSETIRIPQGQAGSASAGGSDGASAASAGAAGEENAAGASAGSSAAGTGSDESGGAAGSDSGGAAGSDSSVEAGAAGAAPAQGGNGPAFPAQLGSSCDSSADCGNAALSCVRANRDFGVGIGAPPGGVCTAQCMADADCKTLGVGAVCAALSEAPLSPRIAVDPAEPRFCMAGCAPGPPAGPSKCHYRDAWACRPFAPVAAVKCATKEPACAGDSVCVKGYCRDFACGPRCEGDSDCSEGRACDPATGLCVSGSVVPTPIGLPCDPDAKEEDTTCAGGTCVSLFDDDELKTGSLCSQSCVIGERCGNGKGTHDELETPA